MLVYLFFEPFLLLNKVIAVLALLFAHCCILIHKHCNAIVTQTYTNTRAAMEIVRTIRSHL